jgi:hypothetical protein
MTGHDVPALDEHQHGRAQPPRLLHRAIKAVVFRSSALAPPVRPLRERERRPLTRSNPTESGSYRWYVPSSVANASSSSRPLSSVLDSLDAPPQQGSQGLDLPI